MDRRGFGYAAKVPQEHSRTLGQWDRGEGRGPGRTDRGFKVVAYDYGIKRNIQRMLADRGCKLTVVSAKTPAAEVLRMQPDGVFLSSGPGDPEP